MAIGRRQILLPIASLAVASVLAAAGWRSAHSSPGPGGGYRDFTIETSGRTAAVVLHALDRGGFCDAAAFGAVSIHPVLTDAPNDTAANPASGLPYPRATVDFLIDSGDGIITGASGGGVIAGSRSAVGVPTYSTLRNASSTSPIRSFPPLVDGVVDECQAWVTVTGAPGATLNLLVILHDDLGDLAFDRVVRIPSAADLTLAYRWTLVTWPGADGVSPRAALSDTGLASGGDDVLDRVTAVYGWDFAAGRWTAFFPSDAQQPGASDLAVLRRGQAYWVAIAGPVPVVWRVVGSP